MSKYSNGLVLLGFFLFVFTLTRQVPLIKYPSLLSLTLIAFLGIVFLIRKHRVKIEKNVFFVFVVTLIGLLFVALYQQQQPTLSLKFFFAVLLLNLVLILDFRDYRFYSIYTFLYSIQSLFVIGLALILIVFFNNETYKPLRHFFLMSSWGDIYTLGNGYYYRIQLMGNALLPFFFFISFIFWKKFGHAKYIMLLAFVANVFAGNLAFHLFIFLFIILFYILDNPKISFKFNMNWLLFILAAMVIVPAFIWFVINTIIRKSTGSVSSIGTRFDQFNVLMNDISSDYFSLLFGKGLGNTLSVVTHSRDYTGNVYYELQSLYFFNQLGVVFTLALIYVHFKLLAARIYNKYLLLSYFMYLGYASTNPYFLDSNHILVLIMLMNLQYKIEQYKKYPQLTK